MIHHIFSGYNLFSLYLALAAVFLQPLLPSSSTKWLMESQELRHLLGFSTLFFLTLVSDTELDTFLPFGTVLVTTTIVYLWFLVASKMTANWWLLLVVLLGGLYLVELYQERQKYEIPELTKAKSVVLGSSLLVTLLGFLIHVGEQKTELKSRFNWSSFLFGSTSSKEAPKVPASYWKMLEAAFQKAPGFMIGGGMSDASFLEALEAQKASTLT
jgi:hypothetical protein